MKALAALLAALAIEAVAATGRSFGAAKLAASAPAPAVAAAPGPAGPPGLEALHINFELKNYNYYDLTKETCPKKVKGGKTPMMNVAPGAKGSGKGKGAKIGFRDPLGEMDKAMPVIKAKDLNPNVTRAVSEVGENTDDIADQIDKGVDIEKTLKADKPPWMKDEKKEKAESLLQLDACAPMPDLKVTKSTECTTVMDVLRTAIKETVLGIINCLMHPVMPSVMPAGAPGPAPMMINTMPAGLIPAAPAGVSGLIPLPIQPAVFLQLRGAGPSPAAFAAPSPGPAQPKNPEVNVFVTFSPGREMDGGRTTMVELAFTDTPNNGIDDVAAVMPHLEHAIASGLFKKQVKKALYAVTGIKPKFHGLEMGMKVIQQWHIDRCEAHIQAIVGQFTLHYTRNQVPMALYNECTNFMTRMSFSHDYILDPRDTLRCRQATTKFAKKWDFGENAQPKDFQAMCVNACEAKYGRNAPTCNIHTGDGLLNQPL